MAEKIKNLFYEVGYQVDDSGLVKADQNTEKLTDGIEGLIGKAAGIVSIGVAFAKISAFIKDSVLQMSELDDATRTVGAKIGVDDTGLGLLRDNAREVGLEFNTMASEVAEAQNYLALAGFDLEKTLASTDELVAAQKASGESMAVVADIITDVSTAYRYSADELGIVGDMAVYTSAKFNTSVGQLGEAYKYVVPVAKSANLELSDLNGYLGVLANNAIKGSMAGTVMRSAITRLTAPTDAAAKELNKYNIELYDSQVNFKGFNTSMKIVERAMKGMNEEQKNMFMQTVFGQEAISGLNIIFSEGVSNITEYGEAIGQAEGKAKEMAQFMEAGLGGAMRGFQVQASETKMIFGEMFEDVSAYIITDLTEALKNANEGLAKTQEDTSSFLVGTYDALKDGARYVGEVIGTVMDPVLDYGASTTTYQKLAAPFRVAKDVLTERGENIRLGLEPGRREASEMYAATESGVGPRMDFSKLGTTITAPISLTINTGGAPLSRDDAENTRTVLKSTMDQWWDSKVKEMNNGLQ